jgi:hypothetical protein
MKKSNLLNFISRYHLAGATTSVKWQTTNGGTECTFISDDQNVVGTVTNTKMNLGETELGVFATPQLVKMLTAVGDDVDVKINAVSDKAVSLGITDGDVNMTFMLADLSVIRQVPKIKQLPAFNVCINISQEFISKFVKAKNALPESENFGIQCKGDEVNFIMNYSSINNNRIKFNVDAVDATDMDIVCFSSTLFKEILMANKDMKTGKFEISGQGLAKVTFEGDDYTSEYFLVQLQAV